MGGMLLMGRVESVGEESVGKDERGCPGDSIYAKASLFCSVHIYQKASKESCTVI